jgi:hypothetical protein
LEEIRQQRGTQQKLHLALAHPELESIDHLFGDDIALLHRHLVDKREILQDGAPILFGFLLLGTADRDENNEATEKRKKNRLSHVLGMTRLQ